MSSFPEVEKSGTGEKATDDGSSAETDGEGTEATNTAGDGTDDTEAAEHDCADSPVPCRFH